MGFYDYLTFLTFVIILVGLTAGLLGLLSLPGRIARKRGHAHADAVELMGWLGVLAAFPG